MSDTTKQLSLYLISQVSLKYLFSGNALLERGGMLRRRITVEKLWLVALYLGHAPHSLWALTKASTESASFLSMMSMKAT